MEFEIILDSLNFITILRIGKGSTHRNRAKKTICKKLSKNINNDENSRDFSF